MGGIGHGRHGRRWSKLVIGSIADDGKVILGLGLDFLLPCGPATASNLKSSHHCNKNLLNSTIERMCRVLSPIAESLIYHSSLHTDDDFSAIIAKSKQNMA